VADEPTPAKLPALWSRIKAFGRGFFSYLVRHWWLGLSMSIVGIGSAVADFNTSPSTVHHYAPTPDYPSGEVVSWDPHGWEIAVFAVGLVVGLLGIVGLFGSLSNRFPSGDTRAARVERLTSALKEAMETIGAIQAEVEDGQRALKTLEGEIAANRDLAQLSETDASAVREFLRREFRRERLPAVWIQLMIGLVLFGLGVAVSAIFHV